MTALLLDPTTISKPAPSSAGTKTYGAAVDTSAHGVARLTITWTGLQVGVFIETAPTSSGPWTQIWSNESLRDPTTYLVLPVNSFTRAAYTPKISDGTLTVDGALA